MVFAAESDIWRWQPHFEVWVVDRRAPSSLPGTRSGSSGPKPCRPGEPIVTRKNKIAYVAGIAVLWIASDWPLHDISEEYLYSAHMIQHLLISMVVPPLLLTAMPEWLARLIISDQGRVGVWTRRMTHPVVAGSVFNLVVVFTHLTVVVNTSAENGPFHYFVHLLVFVSAIWMWTPVIGPIPEVRISPQGQIVYLFLMSVIPTVPAGFLTFAEGTLYEAYDHQVRLFGMSVATDQQMAGLIMKLVGGFYLWGWIIYRFFQFSSSGRGDDAPIVTTPQPGGPDDGAESVTGEDADVDLTLTRSPRPSRTAARLRPNAPADASIMCGLARTSASMSGARCGPCRRTVAAPRARRSCRRLAGSAPSRTPASGRPHRPCR